MKKILLLFVIIITVYLLIVFQSPDFARNLDKTIGLEGMSTSIQKFKNFFDTAVTNIPSKDEVLEFKDDVIEKVDYTKDKIDEVRETLSGAEDAYNDAVEFLSGASDKIDQAHEMIDQIKGISASGAELIGN